MSAPLTPDENRAGIPILDANDYYKYFVAPYNVDKNFIVPAWAVDFADKYSEYRNSIDRIPELENIILQMEGSHENQLLLIHQQTAARDERIKFLEQWADTTEHLINSYKESEKEKDERIKELEQEMACIDRPTWDAYNHAVTETGEANMIIEEKDARIAELEKEVTFLKSIRHESFSLLIPIIEWGQSPEIGLALNSSIAQECLTRAKKSDWYKEQFDLLRESYSTIVPERNQLLEKVEQLEKDIVKYTRQEKELHNIIEEQRSTLVTRYALLKDTQAERDQAFDLLKEVYQKMMSKRAVNRMETHQKVSDFLLSSRENKKP